MRRANTPSGQPAARGRSWPRRRAAPLWRIGWPLWLVLVLLLGVTIAAPASARQTPRLHGKRAPTPTPTPLPTAVHAAPQRLDLGGATGGGSGIVGDCDGGGTVSINELIRGVAISLALQPLDRCPVFDRNRDGRVSIDELIGAVNIALNGPPPTPTPTVVVGVVSLIASSPAHGEGGVALTRETILRFDGALDPATVTRGSIASFFAGGQLMAHQHLSPDNRTVTLFYDEPLPASARVRIMIDGSFLRAANGRRVDADADGDEGGIGLVDFDTVALATIPGTAVCGRVFASELVPGQSGQSLNVPLEGVTIEVDGLPDVRAVTDQFGNFRLEPAPAGRFFVFIVGTTATNNVPAGAYYPNVGKAWVALPGVETNIGEIFLPLIEAGTLQPVSQTQDTVVRFPPSVLQDFPQFSDVRLTVPADSLFADNGVRGGSVGIAPVPPDRIPSRLPPGLAFPLVITVQTDGAQNFDAPVPVCFPNLPDPQTGRPLAPGAESALWSFNHDTGEFEVVGPMRVTLDGRLVCTVPGGGIVAPGWHGSQPGVGASGGPILGGGGDGSGCPVCEPEPCPTCDKCCQSCGDGLVCTNCGEQCDEGVNNGGPNCTADCQLPCTHPDSGGCQQPPPPDGDCGTNVCNQTSGACEFQPTNAGGACDVGNPCSLGGTCDANGNCDSQPNNAGTCDDGQECTSGDHCEDGQCVGNPLPPGTACCGNGQIDPGEECDNDGANSDAVPDACRTNCSRAFCGDGIIDSMGASGAEQCDDGEAQNTGAPNACRPNCQAPRCGDNIVDTNFGEECDLANDNSLTPNSCRPDCKNPRCGDGIVDDDFGETCDDGLGNSNTIPNACRENCRRPRCGDGVVDGNEVCDDGNTADGDGCNNDCIPECGNGTVDPGEQCDDDNTVSCDGCSSTCRTERCGNGVVECSEQCDEGGVGGAGANCRNPCRLPACGDGMTDANLGEECDDGGTTPGDGCSAICRIERCGNFTLDPNEACDDGNTASCDGCAGDCARPDKVCGDGIQECGEGCDNGVNNSDVLPDRCRATTCTPAHCGDGVRDTGEGCDDGNSASGDGCSSACQTEPGTNPICGDGIVNQPTEQCDDGAANADAPNACRLNCQRPRCGDGIEDNAPPNLESCDDGNQMGGDACPANCQLDLLLEPRLIVGLGLCGPQPRDIRLTELPSGQVLTTDPSVEYEFISPDGLDRQIIDQVWTQLRQRQMQKGVPQDELLPEQPPIVDIEVVNGQVVFKSTEGVNVLRARRGNATSNFAVVIGGMQLAEVKSLTIKPFSFANLATNTLVDLINAAFKKAERDFSIDPPMFLFLGQLCFALPDITPGDVGLVGVEKLKFDLFGGRIEDVDLMEEIAALIDLIPANSPIRWIAEALGVGAPVAIAQLLEFSVGDNGGEEVITVSENFSLTDPPFLGGIVEAVAPGVAVVEGKFEMECVGEAKDDMLVFVAPELVGTDIRNEAGVIEDPLLTPFAPEARRPHAVGFFNVLSGTHQLEIETEPLLPDEEIEFLEALLPGELEIAVGLTQPFTLPLGAFVGQSGFYEGGDFFFSIDGIKATFAAAGGVTLELNSVDLQLPLPNFATEWTVLDPPIAVLDNNPSPVDIERELSCIEPGDTEVRVDACLIGASVNTVSDVNGVHCRDPIEPCGDGTLDPGETCDPPGEPILTPPSVCRGDCTFCGDGIVQLNVEACDDGNAISGDGCEPNCLPTFCGDSVVQGPNETCDPPGLPRPPHGNLCRSNCTFCGDGRVDPGEACDDGAAPGGCLPNCSLPTPTATATATQATATATATPTAPPLCGDGMLQPPEQCDDGNQVDGDGCDSNCTLTPTPPPCGDGVVQPPEQCDDGNAIDGDGCDSDCTLTVGVPLANELCITEVVTDPQRDWSDSTGAAGLPFDATPGPGPVTAGDPDNEYIEIRNPTNRALSLAGVFLRMTDASPAGHLFGVGSTLEHYSLGANAFFFPPGAVVVIGNPAGEIDDEIYLELLSPTGALITDLEIGGNFASTNFEADDDHDGRVNEDGPDGLDNDGDLAVDEDGAFTPFKPDPTEDGAPGAGLDGAATGQADEALHRVADVPLLAAVGPLAFEFPIDSRNYRRGPGTPGKVAAFPSQLTIDEVVTRPLRDWSDSTGQVGVPFDEFPGPGAVAAGDPRNEFIEIRNRGLVAVRVRDMVVQMNDATPEVYRIGSPTGGTVEHYVSPGSTPSSADALQSGGVLVIGDPPGSMDDQIYIALVVPCLGTVSDVEIGGNTLATNFESDTDHDGAVDEDPLNGVDDDGDGFTDEDRNGPDPIGDGALAAGGEALRRSADTPDDATSFVRGNGDPGRATGPTP